MQEILIIYSLLVYLNNNAIVKEFYQVIHLVCFNANLRRKLKGVWGTTNRPSVRKLFHIFHFSETTEAISLK